MFVVFLITIIVGCFKSTQASSENLEAFQFVFQCTNCENFLVDFQNTNGNIGNTILKVDSVLDCSLLKTNTICENFMKIGLNRNRFFFPTKMEKVYLTTISTILNNENQYEVNTLTQMFYQTVLLIRITWFN